MLAIITRSRMLPTSTAGRYNQNSFASGLTGPTGTNVGDGADATTRDARSRSATDASSGPVSTTRVRPATSTFATSPCGRVNVRTPSGPGSGTAPAAIAMKRVA